MKYHKCAATELLERFVDLYGETPLEGSMIEPGMELWREYWLYSGQHMILTDEGWEPADDALESYVDMVDGFEHIHEAVQDEINWQYGKRKYPRIFPRKIKERP